MLNPAFINDLRHDARQAARLSERRLKAALRDIDEALQGRHDTATHQTLLMLRKVFAQELQGRMGAGPSDDTSILDEIEAVLPHITQIDDGQLASYKTQAAKIMSYSSGYAEAQRNRAAQMVRQINAEQERRKGKTGASSKTSEGAGPKTGAGSKAPARQNPPTSTPPPVEPTPAAEEEESSLGPVVLGGGMALLIVLGIEGTRRAHANRQKSMGGA